MASARQGNEKIPVNLDSLNGDYQRCFKRFGGNPLLDARIGLLAEQL